MSDNDKKVFRSMDALELRNVRIMKIDEPRELNDETTLCSFSVVSQPGNEKDMDQWVRVTGKNGLAERIFNSQVGDRVNVRGKPFFGTYEDKDGNTRFTVEIKFPEYVDFLSPRSQEKKGPPSDNEGAVAEVDETPPVQKRKPGRPRKNTDDLPFEE